MISLSITGLCLIILITIFSILVANFAHIVSIDKEFEEKLNKHLNSPLKSQDKLHINDENEHLMWFIQISDLHISIFNDPSRISQLNDFAGKTIDIIKPSVVLASGDITDARKLRSIGSRQYIEEWKIYKNILESNDIQNKTVWLDIRGNHDYFNVPEINSELNYFNKYSMQGKTHQRSYLYQITVNSDKYSFIAVDACLEPGPKRPLNFIGMLDMNETTKLIELNEEARKNGGKYTVWFGHYPTSCILTPGTGVGGIRKIIGNFDESYTYLNGHLHTLGGFMPKMYTIQKEGFLELELGDWKDNRLFRVAAFDHGLFSFIDCHYNDWPIVLVTNPKHALLNIPKKEKIHLQLESSHIRILIFSPSEVINCRAKIDGDEWMHCKQMSINLFVVSWEPKNYEFGIHYLNVNVQTDDGKMKEVHQPFSLDGTKMNFDLFPSFILMADLCKLFQALFGVAELVCVVPLCIVRIFHELVRADKLKLPKIKSNYFKKLFRKLWYLSSINRIFIPYILQCVYISIGPWSICEIVDGHYGVVFVWGIFINNSFIPGSLTYIYGFLQLLFCQYPLILIYANILQNRNRIISGETNNRLNKKIINKFQHLPFISIILIEIVLASFFWNEYGIFSFIFGPFRTWSVILHVTLWFLARNVPQKCLQPTIDIWKT